MAPATAPVAVSAAQETAPEASTPVVNTSVQFTSLHSSWSQPVALCGGPVQSGRAREGQRVGQQVRGRGLDLHAAQVQRARRLLHQPGDRQRLRVQLCDSALRHQEVQASRAPDSLRGRDAHVVVVGRADVHYQVGGRAQPVPAAERARCSRRRRSDRGHVGALPRAPPSRNLFSSRAEAVVSASTSVVLPASRVASRMP